MRYLIILVLLIPSLAHASIPIKFDLTRAKIKELCAPVSTTACYSPTYNIILMNSEDLKGEEYDEVYYHELGHYYLWDQDLEPLFRNSWYGGELSADGFSIWIRGKKIEKKYANFYQKIVNKKNAKKY